MKTKFFVAFVILLFCSIAIADDLYPPEWRGEPGTTFQLWEFDTNQNPSPPDILDNPYGIPIATVLGTFPKTRWLAVDRDQQGVWVTEEWIQLDIPNTQITEPDSFKEIWLQITFDGEIVKPPLLYVLPEADPYTLEPVLLQPDPLGTYFYGLWNILIEPNPAFETIYIMPHECTLYVDQIVVDTRCVVIPEPSTMIMMILGGIAFMIRRK